MEINIPFKSEMKQKVLEGTKRCTSRTKKYGSEGDYFILDDRKFTLSAVVERSMEFIATYCHESEGFSSPEEYKNFITKVVGLEWNDERILFLHWFKELDIFTDEGREIRETDGIYE